ncbi:hypothetical protein IAQ61_001286 [Plenodomus lingam]|uniref:uncharacterized protein n=1 Tax=Leptosphaeria maculans TaxID=5022 RepID=UPI00331F5D3A|nr:hypothetical protein IAQ61_001286 [Plenodomus lingam]
MGSLDQLIFTRRHHVQPVHPTDYRELHVERETKASDRRGRRRCIWEPITPNVPAPEQPHTNPTPTPHQPGMPPFQPAPTSSEVVDAWEPLFSQARKPFFPNLSPLGFMSDSGLVHAYSYRTTTGDQAGHSR